MRECLVSAPRERQVLESYGEEGKAVFEEAYRKKVAAACTQTFGEAKSSFPAKSASYVVVAYRACRRPTGTRR